MQVIFVAKADCRTCAGARQALEKVHHEFRHVDVREVDADDQEGRSLATRHGIMMLPALIVNERLRLIGDISEKDIRREVEKAKRDNRP
jgi:glutaredoxin